MTKYAFLSSVTPELNHFLTNHRHRIIVLLEDRHVLFLSPCHSRATLLWLPLKKNKPDLHYDEPAFDLLLRLGEYFQVQDDYLSISRDAQVKSAGSVWTLWTSSVHSVSTRPSYNQTRHSMQSRMPTTAGRTQMRRRRSRKFSAKSGWTLTIVRALGGGGVCSHQ